MNNTSLVLECKLDQRCKPFPVEIPIDCKQHKIVDVAYLPDMEKEFGKAQINFCSSNVLFRFSSQTGDEIHVSIGVLTEYRHDKVQTLFYPMNENDYWRLASVSPRFARALEKFRKTCLSAQSSASGLFDELPIQTQCHNVQLYP
jgi:hypothetical protein